MDLKEQIIAEYLTQGCGFRKLAAKYGISRTTICKWVLIHLQFQLHSFALHLSIKIIPTQFGGLRLLFADRCQQTKARAGFYGLR